MGFRHFPHRYAGADRPTGNWVPSPIVSEPPPYIAFEGGEGCGKSTQAARLAESIGAVLTRETGGTDIGARLRTILHDTSVHNLNPCAEALIAAAS